MTGKLSKRARNPQAVDNWLDSLELYRKSVAYDETCMFRAVSEQLFDCQVFHERVRKECIEYGREHYQEFLDTLNVSREDWLTHLNMLEKHMVVCGNREIILIGRKYNRDVLIVCANQKQVIDITKRDLPSEPLMLCVMDDDHYDAVYKKAHITDTGFCQSLVYKVLYENVFKIGNVDRIVDAMLYEKCPVITLAEFEDSNKKLSGGVDDIDNAVIAPFPFKVAKALDPNIYRNIEYDSWNDVRKELRLGDWYKGDDKLKLGTKCILSNINSRETLDCYIQQFHQDDDKCIVYITKLAEKRLVKYTDLAPENNAKPWPIPFRFTKNLTLNTTTKLAPMEKVKAVRNKNKEARQQSKSAIDLASIKKDDISGFLGAPLQIQGTVPECNNVSVATEIAGLTHSTSEGLVTPVTPECGSFSQRFQWDQANNNSPPQLTPLQFASSENLYYSQVPESVQQNQAASIYEYKPMVASAPVTPNVISYHDTSYPFYFNYHVPQYPHYPLTPITPMPTCPITPNRPENQELAENFFQRSPSQHYPDLGTSLTQPLRMVQSQDQNVAYLPHTPQPVDVYSPMANLSVGPPVIYTTAVPSPNVAVVVPSSPTGSYGPSTPIPPPGYIYPPNETVPQTQWYGSAGVDHHAHMFIFPTPNVQEQ
ncbi:protein ovarian tumor locus-like [Euwallacea fornicatus]|uniref:protein ovarian tumor locus-like n=1 Tax=Euwallacea fornicatus TaxID=995702 RepID=UPI00338E875C